MLTGWSDADHRQRFYDGLDDHIKDLFALSERPKAMYMETRTLASDIDQRVRQREAEKSGKPYQPDSQTGGGKGSRDPNAMEIDASKQDKGKEKKTRFTYLQSMKGRCFGCGSKERRQSRQRCLQSLQESRPSCTSLLYKVYRQTWSSI